MFSVVFPGQGSQSVGMASNLYNKYNYIKDLFNKADDVLGQSLSKLILEGPIDELNQTQNTQPAIFLVSYSIFEMIKRESNINLDDIKYFAGHSLGEYSALACGGAIAFDQTIKLLKVRGMAMQSAVPENTGGMIAVLGSDDKTIASLLEENKKKYECFIANDNSNGQLVISGTNKDLDLLSVDLKKHSIKNIKLPVSAPFHCKLMQSATNEMEKEINNIELVSPRRPIISNVTAKECKDPIEIKQLLIKQIENPVRWRESVIYLLKNNITKILEIGPGKVLSGLIKRIDRSVLVSSVNNMEDLKNFNLND